MLYLLCTLSRWRNGLKLFKIPQVLCQGRFAASSAMEFLSSIAAHKMVETACCNVDSLLRSQVTLQAPSSLKQLQINVALKYHKATLDSLSSHMMHNGDVAIT